jgi:hypothetical protein
MKRKKRKKTLVPHGYLLFVLIVRGNHVKVVFAMTNKDQFERFFLKTFT